MQRRKFFVKAGGALVAAGAATIANAPNVIAQPRVQWRMPTLWPPSLDVLQGNAQRFARIVDELTGGHFKIQVFAGGELMPATGIFDACVQGTVEAFNGGAYYWAGKETAFQWFTSVPFGLNAQGYTAWYQQGDGLKLWEEAYAPFGVVPRPGQSTNPQMGGWFRKKMNTVDDMKGLKIRIPGLAGKVYAKAGAAVVLLPPGEIYTALERGTIDATEFIGPYDDLKLGFQNAARYYYYPGWQEATSIAEFSFNKKAYDALPADYRHALDYAAAVILAGSDAEYFFKNAIALQRLTTEFKTKVELIQFPAAIIDGARKLTAQVMQEEADKSPMAKKVAAGYAKFVAVTSPWAKVEGAYYSVLG
ncbi:MAG TPA: ABC transporter substrate-binding protein [Candidatus Binatia bacterium]|nr:ABC transporter substrate-binding protein [Candidatus Binatia bacterium]